jgi:hypothetical protein
MTPQEIHPDREHTANTDWKAPDPKGVDAGFEKS